MVLGKLGLLKGKKATCYPGFEQYLEGADCTGAMVEKDGNVITGKGPGAAMEFALAVVELLQGKDKVAGIERGDDCLIVNYEEAVMNPMKYVLIVAGGKGLRMGCELPKQFLPIGGKPVLMRTIEAFYAYNAGDTDNIGASMQPAGLLE